MEAITIRPEREYKTTLYISLFFVTLFATIIIVPLIVFIPDTAGKIVFGVFYLATLIVLGLYMLWIPAFCSTLEFAVDGEAVRASKGVFWKKRVSVPYGKITNVDITQGPLQRRYALATVHVQTAGAGGAQGAAAELRITGIGNFEEVKELIMKLVVRKKGAVDESKPAEDEVALLGSILNEIRALREEMRR